MSTHTSPGSGSGDKESKKKNQKEKGNQRVNAFGILLTSTQNLLVLAILQVLSFSLPLFSFSLPKTNFTNEKFNYISTHKNTILTKPWGRKKMKKRQTSQRLVLKLALLHLIHRHAALSAFLPLYFLFRNLTFYNPRFGVAEI